MQIVGAGVHIKDPIKNSYQDSLGRMTQTLDHVVVVHILIWDRRKSQITEYSDVYIVLRQCSMLICAIRLPPRTGCPFTPTKISWIKIKSDIQNSVGCRSISMRTKLHIPTLTTLRESMPSFGPTQHEYFHMCQRLRKFKSSPSYLF